MAQVPVKFKIEIETAKARRSMRRLAIAAGVPLRRADSVVDACSLTGPTHRRLFRSVEPPCAKCAAYKPRHAARVAAEQDER